ncbi:MAG: IS1595 family transposase, partial [Verrucomicrobiota bacterium]
MYERRSRLSRHKQSELLKLFVAGTRARAASEIVG